MKKFPPLVLRRFRRIRKVLGTKKLYFVGGAVRDLILDRDPHDYDLCTDLSPDKVESLLKTNLPTAKVLCTNKIFGTVRIIFSDGLMFEITTFRKEERYSDFSHPDNVIFGTSLEEDLKRRDFTINSIAHDGDRIIDPLGGRKDLEKRILQFNGKPDDRIKEDPIRLIRFARFTGEIVLSNECSDSCKALMYMILNVPEERIRQELDKIFDSNNCHAILKFMAGINLLGIIFPCVAATQGVTQNKHHSRQDVFDHTMKSVEGICKLKSLNNLGKVPHLERLFHHADKDLKLATLFHDVGKPKSRRWDTEAGDFTFHGHEEISAQMALHWMTRMKYSSSRIKRVTSLVRNHMFSYPPRISDKAIRRLLVKINTEHCTLDDVLRLRIADRYGNATKQGSVPRYYPGLLERIEKIKKEATALRVADVKVSGKDVMNVLGIKPGEEVGRVLNTFFSLILDGKIKNDRVVLLELLRIIKDNYKIADIQTMSVNALGTDLIGKKNGKEKSKKAKKEKKDSSRKTNLSRSSVKKKRKRIKEAQQADRKR